jgi:hypothetical protein
MGFAIGAPGRRMRSFWEPKLPIIMATTARFKKYDREDRRDR